MTRGYYPAPRFHAGDLVYLTNGPTRTTYEVVGCTTYAVAFKNMPGYYDAYDYEKIK